MLTTGLERLFDNLDGLRGKRLGVACNHTAVDRNLDHLLDRLGAAGVSVHRIFAPEHGLHATAQDMIAVEGEDDGPAVVSLYGKTVDTLRPAAALLADLDRGEESLASRIGVPLDAIAWAQIDPGFLDVAPLARLDAFLEAGVPRFLELNAESPAGMGYASVLGPLLLADPAAAGWGALGFTDPVPHVIRTVRALAREWCVGTQAAARGIAFGRAFRITIVDFAGAATAPEFDLLAAAFRAAGHPTVVVSPSELRFDGDRLHAAGAPVDVLFRRLLVSNLRAQPDACGALLAAIRSQRVCMVNSLRTALLHCKGIFALMHDPRFALSPAERQLVDRHVPVTLLCNDDARERVRREPDRWVLKPVDGHGGRGVVLGWSVGRAAWERAVDGAEGCIVQARVNAPTGRFYDARNGQIHTRAVDLGPFLARGRFAGFLCRVVEGELANVSAGGASQVPVFSYAGKV